MHVQGASRPGALRFGDLAYLLCSSSRGLRLRPASAARIFSLCSSDRGLRLERLLRLIWPLEGSRRDASELLPFHCWQTGQALSGPSCRCMPKPLVSVLITRDPELA